MYWEIKYPVCTLFKIHHCFLQWFYIYIFSTYIFCSFSTQYMFLFWCHKNVYFCVCDQYNLNLNQDTAYGGRTTSSRTFSHLPSRKHYRRVGCQTSRQADEQHSLVPVCTVVSLDFSLHLCYRTLPDISILYFGFMPVAPFCHLTILPQCLLFVSYHSLLCCLFALLLISFAFKLLKTHTLTIWWPWKNYFIFHN